MSDLCVSSAHPHTRHATIHTWDLRRDTWDSPVTVLCELWEIWTWHQSVMCECDLLAGALLAGAIYNTVARKPYWQKPRNLHWHVRLSSVMWIMENMDLACETWEIWTLQSHVAMWLGWLDSLMWRGSVLCECDVLTGALLTGAM